MSPIHPLAAAHALARLTRHDTHRFLRPDWRRYVQPGSELAKLSEQIERKYRPDQPRVPAGGRDGGRWTADGSGSGAGAPSDGSTSGNTSGRNDPRVLSDANPENDAIPGAQYAQNRRITGGFGRIIINGQEVEPTPAQAARLVVAEAESRQLIEQVRQIEPNWKPAPSAYSSAEGVINAYQADAQQARDRLSELSRVGPGPFASESIPARGPGWDFTNAEREQINEIGSRLGCHTAVQWSQERRGMTLCPITSLHPRLATVPCRNGSIRNASRAVTGKVDWSEG